MVKFVRDSKLVWPYCSDCGCRLEIKTTGRYEAQLSHHGIFSNGDSRGCSCSNLFKIQHVPIHKVIAYI